MAELAALKTQVDAWKSMAETAINELRAKINAHDVALASARTAQEEQKARIAELEEKLKALGPKPEVPLFPVKETTGYAVNDKPESAPESERAKLKLPDRKDLVLAMDKMVPTKIDCHLINRLIDALEQYARGHEGKLPYDFASTYVPADVRKAVELSCRGFKDEAPQSSDQWYAFFVKYVDRRGEPLADILKSVPSIQMSKDASLMQDIDMSEAVAAVEIAVTDAYHASSLDSRSA